ncbi:hypothetical protein A5320_20810 [Rheinheimera sp. SA_1]|nr:hypothetical protein A5320_20810 [Rheinheimera sp. SA_1]
MILACNEDKQMKKTSAMLLHSLLWAAAMLLLAWWFKEDAIQSSWLFCAVALWCCSHNLLQYGFCKRRQADVDALDNSRQCKLTAKKS